MSRSDWCAYCATTTCAQRGTHTQRVSNGVAISLSEDDVRAAYVRLQTTVRRLLILERNAIEENLGIVNRLRLASMGIKSGTITSTKKKRKGLGADASATKQTRLCLRC